MRLLKLFSVVFAAVAAVLFGVTVLLQFWGRDTQGPEIVMDSDRVEISVGAGDESILAGVTAQDSKDGDVTDSLVVESLSNFVGDGERIASIAAFDSDNHVTKTTRIVCYTDYTAPHFSLTAPFSVAVGSNVSTVTQNLSAQDCLDGDVTRRISRVNAEGSTFNIDVPGIYRMVFSVSNDAGDVEKFTASVEVYDRSDSDLPSIGLTDALLYLSMGSDFNPLEYLDTVTVDGASYQMFDGTLVRSNLVGNLKREGGDLSDVSAENIYETDAVEIENPVDVNTPGWYEVSYTVTSALGTERTAFLLVRVEE